MATPKTVALHTLGCKLNYSETSTIERMFQKAGYGIANFPDIADVYVINTCSVTEFADRKCRQIVRRAMRSNPSAKVIMIGCYAQLKPKEIIDIPGVDLVLGAAEKFRILDYVDQIDKATDKGMIQAGAVSEANTFVHSFSFGDRTRSFLKVQDGCDYKCSFCTIPQARGKSRSNEVQSIVQNAEQIASLGVKEIVLTGVNIGDFGNGTEVIEGVKPKKDAMLIDLLIALDKVKGIERFRISSIEPNLCTNEIIEFVAKSDRFAPHFHMPLQSGNDKQLKAMRRRYKRALYAERVQFIKQVMPHACIGVDVIVGFPGETDDDFLESLNFIKALDVSYLHVFTYSERANTPAVDMEGKIPMATRKKRNEMLRMLSLEKKNVFYKSHLETQRPVLFEQHKDDSLISGFTDNYIKIERAYHPDLINTVSEVSLKALKTSAEVVLV